MKGRTLDRVRKTVVDTLPSTGKTCLWILKLTVGVSFAMMLLKMSGVLPWISNLVSPFFHIFGLPGVAALAFVPGYFVNCYSCIAVACTLNLDVRSMTILFTMQMCAHSIILESAVLKKTGVSVVRMVIVRTVAAFLLGFLLNTILPGEAMASGELYSESEAVSFWPMLGEWALSTLKLSVTMTLIIFSLNIFQRLLTEFGIMKIIALPLKPLMAFFGLPSRAAFLWIVANVTGLAYGAAAMLDEIGRGGLSKRDVELVDTHICISHSNLEDLSLFAALGASWWVMLLSRWAMSFLLVWERRFELMISDRFRLSGRSSL